MADNDAGDAIGVIFLVCIVIIAVLAAVAIVLIAGSLIGFGVGFANYCKAFQNNVRRERPAGL